MTVPAAIAFSCDEPFSPLLKGLVLSLNQCGYLDTTTSLVLLNFDCSSETLTWLADRAVQIVSLSDDVFTAYDLDAIKPHQRAQICRPYLPDILPDFETFLWLDSDTWVQEPEAVRTLLHAAQNTGPQMLIAPELHVSYPHLYSKTMSRFVAKHTDWYRPFTDSETAEDFGARAVLNSGVFCLNKDSSVWNAWSARLETQSDPLSHISEQVALNAVLYDSGDFTVVDPVFNYMALFGGTLTRDPVSRAWVCSSMVPARKIEIMHLASFSTHGARYQKQGLLFDQGAYLDINDFKKLNALSSHS